jgi:hypothetical protein
MAINSYRWLQQSRESNFILVSENWESSQREIGPISAKIDENPVLSPEKTQVLSYYISCFIPKGYL